MRPRRARRARCTLQRTQEENAAKEPYNMETDNQPTTHGVAPYLKAHGIDRLTGHAWATVATADERARAVEFGALIERAEVAKILEQDGTRAASIDIDTATTVAGVVLARFAYVLTSAAASMVANRNHRALPAEFARTFDNVASANDERAETLAASMRTAADLALASAERAALVAGCSLLVDAMTDDDTETLAQALARVSFAVYAREMMK